MSSSKFSQRGLLSIFYSSFLHTPPPDLSDSWSKEQLFLWIKGRIKIKCLYMWFLTSLVRDTRTTWKEAYRAMHLLISRLFYSIELWVKGGGTSRSFPLKSLTYTESKKKKKYKWTHLQNRHRIPDIENKLMVIKGEKGVDKV